MKNFDYILSILNILVLYLAGKKTVWAWRVGTFNNILWLIYTYNTKQFGLFIGAVVYFVITLKNLIEWEKEKQKSILTN